MGFFKRYGYAWLTLAFFAVSMVLHLHFGWLAFQDTATDHGQTPEYSAFLTEWARDVFENWQSEFLQLLWQVVGLAYFLYIGSPSSKENDDRMEAKIDALIRITGGKEGGRLIEQLDELYARTHGNSDPFAHSDELARKAGENVPHVAARATS
ncbi:hypothetical protein HJG53_00675 [Sphingomonas sp. ID1715]|uniref:DUF6766 family protein n=1 Tax=Sphingomonas sp. ID1715 TaxID=1656898 RepID=UPI001489C461|nr:DUF6766 family protein [Sphingomonas sp. ID1715]NNM75423.1 hypothetical protein [Sphingomonas sp. ID1715]